MRGIRLTGAVLAAALTVGVTAAASAAPAAQVKPVKQTCKVAYNQQADQGGNTVNVADQSGNYLGGSSCSGHLLGAGVQASKFVLQDDGSIKGKYRMYLYSGTLQGTYVLLPTDTSFTDQAHFAYQRFTGTVKVLGGSGIYAGFKGKGTVKCTTSDAVHLSCVEKLKLIP